MSELACKNCKFWSEIPGGIIFIEGEDQRPAGECRINPPSPQIELATHAYGKWGLVNWPVLGEHEWCGGHQEKPKAKKAPAIQTQQDPFRNHQSRLQSQLQRKQRVVLLGLSPNEKQFVFGSTGVPSAGHSSSQSTRQRCKADHGASQARRVTANHRIAVDLSHETVRKIVNQYEQ